MNFDFDANSISSVSSIDPTSTTLTITGSGALVVPNGTTAQAPTGVAGALRFNTDTSTVDFYNGASWKSTQVSSTSLNNIIALSGAGIMAQTTPGNYALRTITGVAGNIVVTNGDGVAGAPIIGLATAGTAGTYSGSITTDAYGRVVSGTNTQAWSTITSTPTTLAGYGVTDAVKNAGGAVSWAAGTFAVRPPAGTVGRFYFATDTNATYFDNGTAWILNEAAVAGDVSIAAGSGSATLATVNSNVGSFGSSTLVPIVTVNAKGLVTAVSTASISGAISVTGGDLTMSGTTGTAITNATLAASGVAAGVYGSTTTVAQITVDAKGRITTASNVTIPTSVTFTGDATGTGAVGGSTALALAASGVAAGVYGATDSVSKITVDAKGRVTSAANVIITPEAIGAVSTSLLGAANGVATLDATGKLTDTQIPAALVGALVYQGTWNASTNTPTLVSGVGSKGQYYKVNVAGSTTIDGYNKWSVGDMIVFNGTTWDAIDGLATEVTSVFGRIGAVTATLASADFANQGTVTTVLTGNAAGSPTWGAVSLTNMVTGTLQASQFPALTGDVTSVAGALGTTLATVNSNVGVFGSTTSVGQFTVNAKGLITAASNVTIPTSLTFTGDATGTGSVGGSTALTLASSGVSAGSYNNVTVNGKGIVTAASTVAYLTNNQTITLSGDFTGSGTTAIAGTLATVNGNVGTYGSTTTVPVITVNAKGLVTAVSTATISGSISVTGGDLTMSGTTGTAITNATLAASGVAAGTYGSTASVPQIVVDTKGRVTSASNVTLTASAVGAVANAGGAPSMQQGTFAAIPPTGTAGRVYITTDTNVIYRDTGSTWVAIGKVPALYAENAVSPIANTVTGANAIAEGSNNIASAAQSRATGLSASATIYGEEARASGAFVNPGDAQSGKYVLRAITTTANPTEVFADGAAARIVLPTNSAFTYKAQFVARRTDATGSHGGFEISGVVARDATASSTALFGNPSKTILTRPTGSGWDVNVSADTTNGALVFKVTGSASQTIRWVVTVTTTEVTN